MTVESFIQTLMGHAGSEDSEFRQSIAKAVLIHKDTHSASNQIFKKVKSLAGELYVPGVVSYLKDPSADMMAVVSNTIFYNKHPVSIAPNRPNNGGKSPKYIADEILKDMSEIFKVELTMVSHVINTKARSDQSNAK
tara:strand:+ start:3261 stop:3671 length:411 start_codon:yes stop_codon:yes gene_type:complete